MTIGVVFFFVLGLALLLVGAEGLVRGASRIAAALGLSPLLIGLTVVAFGTSSPELAINLKSAFQGAADIAIGNVVGSNICNVLLILGISAIAAPLSVQMQIIRWETPLVIIASLAVFIMSADGALGRAESGLLFLSLIVYLVFVIRAARRESAKIQKEYAEEYKLDRPRGFLGFAIQFALVIGGLALLTIGARLMVNAAIQVAKSLGVSDLVIGLTVIAVGTSLPELATSVMASVRGERDIAVGNVIGSSLFNLLGVLGLTGVITPFDLPVSPQALAFDIPIMILVSLACFPIFFTGSRITRWEGFLFLFYYIIYTVYLVLESGDSSHIRAFNQVVLIGFFPLTVIMLVVTFGQSLRRALKRGRGLRDL